jgi:hypothetical protein
MHLALLISAALSTKTWHTPSIPHTTRENMEFSKRKNSARGEQNSNPMELQSVHWPKTLRKRGAKYPS